MKTRRVYQWFIGRESDVPDDELGDVYDGCEMAAYSSHDAALVVALRFDREDADGEIISVRPDNDHSDVTVWRVIVEDGRTRVERVP